MSLDVDGLDELEDLTRRLPEIALDAAEPAMDKALLLLHSRIPPYPGPPVPSEAAKHWTDKQRAWFFANLRKGTLKLPYRRTGVLGQQITTEHRREAGAVEGEIGTATEYAPWVIGPDYPGETIRGQQMFQARLHAGRWYQFDDVIEANERDALDVLESEWMKEFSQRVARS